MPPIRLEDPFRDPTVNLRDSVNPFLSKLRQALSDESTPLLYGEALKPWRGKWRQAFAGTRSMATRELVLEIGSHKGEVLKRLANDFPDTGFLGMDITFKRVVTLADKAKELQLDNLISILCNAKAVEQVFAPDELDGVLIFFPDPWVRKKRQRKNRLLNQEFLTNLATCLQPEGWLWFKTDAKDYFDEVCSCAKDLGYRDLAKEQHPITAAIYTSRFEQHFQSEGLPTYERIFAKPLN